MGLAITGFGAVNAQQLSRAQVGVGQTYSGQLTSAFLQLEDGSYVDCQVLRTGLGRNEPITLRSGEFDTLWSANLAHCEQLLI